MNSFEAKYRHFVKALIGIVPVICVIDLIRFVRSEVTPYFPRWDDQGYYLVAAHQYFNFAKQNGFCSLIREHFKHNVIFGFYPYSNLHMSLLASFAFRLFGVTRLGALSIHITSWCLMLGIFAWFARKISGQWAYSAMVVGLCLSTGFGFVGAGGITDFRMEFPSACWYGITLALWCFYLQNQNASSCASAAIVNLALIFFRPITLAYWIPCWILLLAFSLRRFRGRQSLMTRHVASAVAFLIFSSGLLILWDYSALKNYYIVKQSGPVEVATRVAMEGAPGTLEHIFYYPLKLISLHFGKYGWIMLSLILILLTAARTFRPKREDEPESETVQMVTLCFAIAAVVSPMAILTISPHRTYQVAGIAAPALALTLGLLVCRLFKRHAEVWPQLIGCLILIFGLTAWQRNLFRGRPFPLSARADLLRLNDVYRIIIDRLEHVPGHPIRGRYAFMPGLSEEREVDLSKYGRPNPPQIAFLDWVDGMNQNAITLYGQEQLGRGRFFEMEIPRWIFPMSRVELLNSLQRADAVIIPERSESLIGHPWPISKSIFENYDALLKEIRNRMHLFTRFNYNQVGYELYFAN